MRHINAANDESKKINKFIYWRETSQINRFKLPSFEEWPDLKKLSNEFEAIGFYLNAHPLDAYGDALTNMGG